MEGPPQIAQHLRAISKEAIRIQTELTTQEASATLEPCHTSSCVCRWLAYEWLIMIGPTTRDLATGDTQERETRKKTCFFQRQSFSGRLPPSSRRFFRSFCRVVILNRTVLAVNCILWYAMHLELENLGKPSSYDMKTHRAKFSQAFQHIIDGREVTNLCWALAKWKPQVKKDVQRH